MSGGGWGVEFSASASYKQTNQEVSANEFMYVMSSASCTNYFARLDMINPPPFDESFLKWVYKLNSASADDRPELYLKFIETYGTHFQTETTFGSRFTYKHKIKSSKKSTLQSSEYSIAAQASYSGAFSVGGGLKLDGTQKAAASNFMKNVETETITVGAAPPANGDALEWASNVANSPVPVRYKLQSIENLFTKAFMSDLNVDLPTLHANILNTKDSYCELLKAQGKIQSCNKLVERNHIMRNTKLTGDLVTVTSNDCVQTCKQRVNCVAVTETRGKCILAIQGTGTKCWGAEFDENYKAVAVFSSVATAPQDSLFVNTKIIGSARESFSGGSFGDCRNRCKASKLCAAFTYCTCRERRYQCVLYAADRMFSLTTDDGSSTVLLSKKNSADLGRHQRVCK